MTQPPKRWSPVVALREGYAAEDYNPDAYLDGATPILDGLGFLTRPVTDDDRATVEKVLDGLYDTGLDVTDVFPFGVVWALRSTGAIEPSPQLDADLNGWREWEETDHLGTPMPFLPALPEERR